MDQIHRRKVVIRRSLAVTGLVLAVLALGWLFFTPFERMTTANRNISFEVRDDWIFTGNQPGAHDAAMNSYANTTAQGRDATGFPEVNKVLRGPVFQAELRAALKHHPPVEVWAPEHIDLRAFNPGAPAGVEPGEPGQLFIEFDGPVYAQIRRSLAGAGGFSIDLPENQQLERDLERFMKAWFRDKRSIADIDFDRYGMVPASPPPPLGKP